MAYTDRSSIYAAIDETALNRIVEHLRRQRPSLFNYGTSLFVNDLDLLCERIDPSSAVLDHEDDLVQEEDPWPIPGTDGALGVDFCLQILDLVFDFHPVSANLPPGLPNPVPNQRLLIRTKVCVGIRCLDSKTRERLATEFWYPPDRKEDNRASDPPETGPGKETLCFCLDVYAIARARGVGPPKARRLAFFVDQIEIVDIEPAQLEGFLECYMAMVLSIGVLPQMQIALERFTFDLGEFGNLWFEMTPTSTELYNNPAVEANQIRIYLDAGIE